MRFFDEKKFHWGVIIRNNEHTLVSSSSSIRLPICNISPFTPNHTRILALTYRSVCGKIDRLVELSIAQNHISFTSPHTSPNKKKKEKRPHSTNQSPIHPFNSHLPSRELNRINSLISRREEKTKKNQNQQERKKIQRRKKPKKKVLPLNPPLPLPSPNQPHTPHNSPPLLPFSTLSSLSLSSPLLFQHPPF